MARELVTPEIGKIILVQLPRYSGRYELGDPGQVGRVKVVRRWFNFEGSGPSGFLGALMARTGEAPRGRRIAFLDRDVAYVSANFLPEAE